MPYPNYKYTYPSDSKAAGFIGPLFNIVDNTSTIYGSVYDSGSAAELIRQSIMRILSENQLERVMLPQFGSKLKSFLFDPNDEVLVRDIIKEINRCLDKWDPRVKVVNVSVEQDKDNNTVYVTVHYNIPVAGASQIVKLMIK
jgi:phage baseplate assembly protein W